MLIIWLAAAAVFLVVELVSPALCSVWFMAGALVSAAAQALGAPLWVQIALFFVVSGLCFAFLYPRLKHLIKRRIQPTNADMLIGKTCIVTSGIDNLAGAGAVSVGGKTWSARSADGAVIPAESLVRVEEIQGVKLIVVPVNERKTV